MLEHVQLLVHAHRWRWFDHRFRLRIEPAVRSGLRWIAADDDRRGRRRRFHVVHFERAGASIGEIDVREGVIEMRAHRRIDMRREETAETLPVLSPVGEVAANDELLAGNRVNQEC